MTYLSPYEMEAKAQRFSIAIIIPIVTNIKITDNARNRWIVVEFHVT